MLLFSVLYKKLYLLWRYSTIYNYLGTHNFFLKKTTPHTNKVQQRQTHTIHITRIYNRESIYGTLKTKLHQHNR